MTAMKPIPISAGKRIATEYGYDQVVIMARKVGEDGGEHVTTYGRDPIHCDVAARMGGKLKEIMRWPIPATARHVTAELEGGEIKLTLYETSDPGPLREWKPLNTFPIDEAHATELLGTLAIALERKRDGARP